MSLNGRIYNCTNLHQGKTKKVLCICSAGLLRSPTAAHILSAEPFNFNTRSAGMYEEYALVPVDDALLTWADEIVCVEKEHYKDVSNRLSRMGLIDKVVMHLVKTEDIYGYRHPKLVEQMTQAFNKIFLNKE